MKRPHQKFEPHVVETPNELLIIPERPYPNVTEKTSLPVRRSLSYPEAPYRPVRPGYELILYESQQEEHRSS